MALPSPVLWLSWLFSDERTSSGRTFRAHQLPFFVASSNTCEVQIANNPQRLATKRELERCFLHVHLQLWGKFKRKDYL
jgi:hypothetical protein